MEITITRRIDGTFVERMDDEWIANYTENQITGRCAAELFHHEKSIWKKTDFKCLEEAQQATHEYVSELLS